jgi:Holliday junction resolvase-like predicted endonuclease
VPAKDRYHDVVVRALQKDGWTIIAEQIALSMPARRLWIDIRAQKEAQNALILVEVKGFETLASAVAYLADAIGQCVLYQAILEYVGITDPLYMAVPAAAFAGILGEEIGRQAIRKAQIRVIVFDAEQEEIVRWIP